MTQRSITRSLHLVLLVAVLFGATGCESISKLWKNEDANEGQPVDVLEFAHPLSGAPIRCTAPVPADLRALMDALRDDQRAAAESAR